MFSKVYNELRGADKVLEGIDEDTVAKIKWFLDYPTTERITEGEIPLLVGNPCDGTKAAFVWGEDWDEDGSGFHILHVVYASLSDDGKYHEPKTKKLRKMFEEDMPKICLNTIASMELASEFTGGKVGNTSWQVVCDYAAIKLIKDEDGNPTALDARVHRNALGNEDEIEKDEE